MLTLRQHVESKYSGNFSSIYGENYSDISWLDGKGVTEQQLVDEVAAINTLQTVETKIQEIKTLRNEKWQGGWLVDGNWFHSNELSKINYLSAKGESPDWSMAGWGTMEEDVDVVMTVELAEHILSTGNLQINVGYYAIAKQHIAQLKASENPQEYDFTKNPDWPDTYEEWKSKEASND